MVLINFLKERMIIPVLLMVISFNVSAFPIIVNFGKDSHSFDKNKVDSHHTDSPPSSYKSASKPKDFARFSDYNLPNNVVEQENLVRLSDYNNILMMAVEEGEELDSSAYIAAQSGKVDIDNTLSYFHENSTLKSENGVIDSKSFVNLKNDNPSVEENMQIVFKGFPLLERLVRHSSNHSLYASIFFADNNPVFKLNQLGVRHSGYKIETYGNNQSSVSLTLYSSNTLNYVNTIDPDLDVKALVKKKRKPREKLPFSVMFRDMLFGIFSPIPLLLFSFSLIFVLIFHRK